MDAPPRKRLSRDERRANTRADLLKAARHHFARNGYEGTAIEQVAEDAGYSRGAFHYNFRNKDELFAEVLRDCFEEDHRNLDLLATALQGDPVKVAVTSFQESARHPESYLLRLEFWMRALRDERFRAIYIEEHRRFRDAIAEHARARLDPTRAAEFAALIMGLHNGLELIHLLDPTAVTPETYRRTLEEVLPAYRRSD